MAHECIDVPELLAEALAEGLLTDDLRVAEMRAVRVSVQRRNDRGWPELIVAARIVGGDVAAEGVVAAWATGADGGPIYALDPSAREFSDWGVAARAGSPAAAMRDRLAAYPEVAAARGCIEN